MARDYASVLHVKGSQKGYMEDDTYVISWCFGHLVEMVYPDQYDIKYKNWRLEDLPFLPKIYRYDVIEKSRDQYKIVNSLLHREDIDVVYWAGDSGKEGQTIEENIRNFGGVREGMQELRVWIDSQTDEEILRGLREAKPMSDYDLLGRSGIMRTIEDYALGINFSRVLSVKYGKLINDAAATKNYTAIAVGRVMTCVLGMVVNRERQIRDFQETPFYRVNGFFSDALFTAEWKAVEPSRYVDSPKLYKENGFKNEEDARALIGELSGHDAIVTEASKSTTKKKAPLLFNLAELQLECSKRFKISPDQTLNIAQELYEKKYTTYPRTDARVLSTPIAKEIEKNIKGLVSHEFYREFCEEILAKGAHKGIEKSAYTDDDKVTDHYAIIPTGVTGSITKLPELQQKVYDLIVRRFLAIFYPNAVYQNIKLSLQVLEEPFFASAKVLKDPGYMKVSGMPQEKEKGTAGEEEEDEETGSTGSKEDLIKFCNSVKKGDTVSLKDLKIKEGKTTPPKRYSSGTLVSAMESAGNLIEDEELRQQIKMTGIGTSATRGDILKKLFNIHYLHLNPKTQIVTPEKIGEMIYEIVNLSVPTLLNPEMTANWEKGLEGIINGTVDDKEYRRDLEDFIRRESEKMIQTDLTDELVKKIRPFTSEHSRGAATRVKLGLPCPDCGAELTTTPFGYGCSNYWNKDEAKKCTFSVGKIAGVSLTEEQFAELIREGRTGVIEGFTSKAKKKKFSAALKLKKDENNKTVVVFDFDGPADAEFDALRCPVCGKNIVETANGFACTDHKEDKTGCAFSISETMGVKFTKRDVISLIKYGRTGIIEGFRSQKTGETFAARIGFLKDENDRITGLKLLFDK